MSSVMLMLLPFSIPPFLYKTTSGHNQVRKIGPKNILSVLEVFKSNNNWLAATYFWSSVHSRNLEVGVQDLIFAFVFKHIVGNSDSTRWSNQVRRLKWNENNLWHGNVSPQSETNSDEFRHLKSCNPCFLMFCLGYLLMCNNTMYFSLCLILIIFCFSNICLCFPICYSRISFSSCGSSGSNFVAFWSNFGCVSLVSLAIP